MKRVTVQLKERSYDIRIGAGAIRLAGRMSRTINLGRDAFVITNRNIARRYGAALTRALTAAGCSVRFCYVRDSEESKSMPTVSAVISHLARFDKKKTIFIVAFGGGVIGDLAGFVASVYKRGTPYIQVPTTLLAQVDSAIGGKTAVDLACGKNLVGAFYQPRLVVSDTRLLASLDARQLKSGLAEVIKYGVIKDPALFAYLERKKEGILSHKQADLEHIVKRCSEIKAAVVTADEREKRGVRTILNFGHTAGHAIEAASGYSRYTHGEAIALGMLVACAVSRRCGLIPASLEQRIEKLIAGVGLPVRITGVALSRIIAAQYHDKKFIGTKNRLVLIQGLGRTKVVDGIPLALIRQALAERM